MGLERIARSGLTDQVVGEGGRRGSIDRGGGSGSRSAERMQRGGGKRVAGRETLVSEGRYRSRDAGHELFVIVVKCQRH